MKRFFKKISKLILIVAIILIALIGYYKITSDKEHSNPITKKIQPKINQNEDLQEAVSEYPTMVDAKTEAFLDYQSREKKINEEVRRLRKNGQQDMADSLIESFDKDFSRVKKVVQGSNSTNPDKSVNKNISNQSYSSPYSPPGTTETLQFNAEGPPVPTTKIYLASGQRMRVKATRPCYIGSTRYFVPAGKWVPLTQVNPEGLEIWGAGKPGQLTIEVLS